jgi:hypothetical protein
MKNKYYIGKMGFKTKKECENYTRNIINDLGCCIINKTDMYYTFFENLLKNHPEHDMKKGVGIKYFFIIPNRMDNKYYQTMIKRLDDSEIDFSWVYCCKFKERTENEDLIRSMRTAIKDDVIKYKQQQQLICNLCKITNESYENYHVDHNNPSFQILKDKFLQQTIKPIPTLFGDCKKYKLTIFKKDDNDFKNDWVDYHNKNCNLQILCRNCNLRKNK